MAQKQALSKVLAGSDSSSSEPTSFGEEVDKLQQVQAVQRSQQHLHLSNSRANPAGLFSSLFQGLTNCTINFSPKNINIGEFASSEVDEFDSIVAQMRTHGQF